METTDCVGQLQQTANCERARRAGVVAGVEPGRSPTYRGVGSGVAGDICRSVRETCGRSGASCMPAAATNGVIRIGRSDENIPWI